MNILSLSDFYANLRTAITTEGSQTAFATKHGMSNSYVCDVLNGRYDPSEKILSAVGLRRVVRFQEIEGVQK